MTPVALPCRQRHYACCGRFARPCELRTPCTLTRRPRPPRRPRRSLPQPPRRPRRPLQTGLILTRTSTELIPTRRELCCRLQPDGRRLTAQPGHVPLIWPAVRRRATVAPCLLVPAGGVGKVKGGEGGGGGEGGNTGHCLCRRPLWCNASIIEGLNFSISIHFCICP